jgi:hypothetical protein
MHDFLTLPQKLVHIRQPGVLGSTFLRNRCLGLTLLDPHVVTGEVHPSLQILPAPDEVHLLNLGRLYASHVPHRILAVLPFEDFLLPNTTDL